MKGFLVLPLTYCRREPLKTHKIAILLSEFGSFAAISIKSAYSFGSAHFYTIERGSFKYTGKDILDKSFPMTSFSIYIMLNF